MSGAAARAEAAAGPRPAPVDAPGSDSGLEDGSDSSSFRTGLGGLRGDTSGVAPREGGQGGSVGGDGANTDTAPGAGAGGGTRGGGDGYGAGVAIDTLRQRLRQVEEENESLRMWAARVEVHLHRYQALDPKLEAVVAQVSEGEDVPPPPWLDNPTDLPPLVKAYDARILELEETIKKQAQAYDEALEGAEALKKELANSHKQLEETTNQLVQKASGNPAAAAVAFGGGDALLEQRAELEDQLELALKECGLLQDQVTTLSKDNSRHMATVADRDKRLSIITQRYQQAVAAVQQLQEGGQRAVAEKQTCETKLMQQTAALAESRRNCAKVVQELKQAKDTMSRQASKIDDLKAAVLELRERMDSEKDEVDEQRKTAAAQARRLQLVVDKQVGELDRYKAELGDVRANYNSVRADAENMLKVMQSYEKQLNEYSAKEARWDALEKESVENVEQARLDRDKAQVKETQGRREIARLLERCKVESAEAARQQNEAVTALRSRMEAQLNKRNKELQSMSMKCTELQALADRCERDRQTAEREAERVMESASQHHDALNAHVQKMVDRMKQVESERDSVVVALREAQAEAAEAERRWSVKQRACQEESDAARQAHEELQHHLEDTKLHLRQAETTIKDLTSQLQDADAKLHKERGRLEARLEAVITEKRSLQAEADRANHEMQLALQQSTDRIAQLQAAEESLRAQYRDEAKNTGEKFSRALEELTEDRNRLAARNEELSAQLTMVSSQREELIVYRQDLDNKLQHMHARVLDAEKRASSGATQLSQAFSDQERRLQELKSARADADRAALAEARALRRQKQLESRVHELQQQYEQLQAFAGGAPGGTLFLENGAATPGPTPRARATTRSTTTTTVMQGTRVRGQELVQS